MMPTNNLHVRPERELRNNFAEIANLNQQRDAVVLTHRGKAAHVLLSYDEFADYEEFRHNRYLMEKVREVEADPDTRRLSHDAIWRKLGKKYGL